MQKILLFTAFAVLLAGQIIPTTEAFIIKTVTFQKGPLPYLPSSDAAIGSITASKNALVQTITNAVTEKINTITALVGSVVQAKVKAKQDLLRTAATASGSVINSVNGILIAKPTIFTKTISFGFKPIYTTTFLPATVATTTVGVPATTYAQSSPYKYRN